MLVKSQSIVCMVLQSGWAAIHYAAKAGHQEVVKLLCDGGASTVIDTDDNKTPICYAAAAGHTEVLSYLMRKSHDTLSLMDDKKVVISATICFPHDYGSSSVI